MSSTVKGTMIMTLTIEFGDNNVAHEISSRAECVVWHMVIGMTNCYLHLFFSDPQFLSCTKPTHLWMPVGGHFHHPQPCAPLEPSRHGSWLRFLPDSRVGVGVWDPRVSLLWLLLLGPLTLYTTLDEFCLLLKLWFPTWSRGVQRFPNKDDVHVPHNFQRAVHSSLMRTVVHGGSLPTWGPFVSAFSGFCERGNKPAVQFHRP